MPLLHNSSPSPSKERGIKGVRLIYNFVKHGGKLNKGMAFIMEGLARNQGSIDATKIKGIREATLCYMLKVLPANLASGSFG